MNNNLVIGKNVIIGENVIFGENVEIRNNVIIEDNVVLGNISDDFLIDQENLSVEFDSEDGLFSEIDKLFLDKEYVEKRREHMQKSVISPSVFEHELQKCIEGHNSGAFATAYEHIDTRKFQSLYLTRLSKIDIDTLTVRRKGIGVAIKYHPIAFFRGGFNIAWKILKGNVL